MKDEISSLDLYFMMKELGILIGGKIDKVFQKDYFLFQLHIPNQGKKLLKITDKAIYFISEKESMPSNPSQFSILLRKKLSNARIRKINQEGFERILEFEVTTKDETYKLVLEFFSGGNVILLDETNKILYAKKYYIGENKKIKRDEIYIFEPKNINDEKVFMSLLENSKKNISKTLAVDIGLGGFFAEEICYKAKIKKDETPSKKIGLKLYSEFKKILRKRLNPMSINDFAFPFLVESVKGEIKKFNSFSEAIESVQPKEQIIIKKNKEVAKVEKIINMQTKKIKEYEEKSKELKEKGISIFNNYTLVEEILKEIKQAKEKHSWKEIQEKLKNHKIIKKINEKRGELEVELR